MTSVYVKVDVQMLCSDGEDHWFECGADCHPTEDGWEIDEPEISAPDCPLKLSRLSDYDFLPGANDHGLASDRLRWETIIEEALAEAAPEWQEGDTDDGVGKWDKLIGL